MDNSARKSEFLPGISEPKLLAAYAAAQPWLRRSYVTGIGIGYAKINGVPTSDLVLSVHVTKRLPIEELRRHQLFPRTLLEVRVVVVEANMKDHLSEEEVNARRRTASIPLRPGVQIKSKLGNYGTITLVLKGKSSTKPYILCSGHVLASVGDEIFQPNSSAEGHLKCIVERVERSKGDAGIAAYSNRQKINHPYGSNIVIKNVRAVRLGDELMMSGAFSGATAGVVDWIGQKAISYADGRTLVIPGFQLEPKNLGQSLTQQGDSGALWFDQFGAGVGINVGGENGSAPWAFASHLFQMMDVLKVEL